MVNELRWKIRVPLFKSRLIRNQLSLAIGIPLGTLVVVLLLAKAYEGLILVGVLLLVSCLLLMLVTRGTYDVQYVLGQGGILCQTQKEQNKRVQRMARLTRILGLLRGCPTAVGAGMIAGAGTDTRISWAGIKRIKFLDEQRTIMIYAGFSENIALFCLEEDYAAVKQYVQEHRA